MKNLCLNLPGTQGRNPQNTPIAKPIRFDKPYRFHARLISVCFLLCFALLPQAAQGQAQLGADIDGEAAGDLSGNSVSLSADGDRLAIGAHWNDGNGENAGHVRVYALPAPPDEEAPAFTASGPFSYPENQAAGEIAGAIVAATDNVAVTRYEITATNPSSANGFFTIDAGTGQISLTNAGANGAAGDFETLPNQFTLTIQASDAAGNNADVDVVLNLQDVDDEEASVFTPGTTGPFEYAENQAAGVIAGAIVAATDNVAVTGYQITATNPSSANGFFSIDEGTGQISLTDAGVRAAANDFKTLPNRFTITVQASDAAGNNASADVTLNVTDVDDADPIITSPATADVAENTTDVFYTITATDASMPIRFSLGSGLDTGLFNLNGAALSFKAAPDFENPQDSGEDNVYEVELIAIDNAGNEAAQTLSVTVTNVDDTIPVTSITITPAFLNLTAGGATGTLNVAIEPANATEQAVRWDSDNRGAATVNENGIVTPLSEGNANITATVADGSREFATATVTVVDPLSVAEEENVSIYPNPVKETLSLKIPKEISASEYEIQILDMNSRLLRSNKYKGGSGLEVDVRDLAAGVHFIVLKSKENELRHRFVKK